jgi:hypothetical protein
MSEAEHVDLPAEQPTAEELKGVKRAAEVSFYCYTLQIQFL